MEGGQLDFEVVEQLVHEPKFDGHHDVWDLDKLLGLAQRAVEYAEAHFEQSAVGIDAWGVDHGFLDGSGCLIQAPICYRDPSHGVQFERLASHRSELFGLTGIAAQPFNTLYQLAARKAEGLQAERWLMLPDLLGFLLGASPFMELTEASTSGLLGLDGRWSERAFELAGWPVPDLAAQGSGCLESIRPTVALCRVGSHDTASAVHGLGALESGTMFLNVGTWALAGVLLDKPVATPEAEHAGFTNERAVSGAVRFLKNVPGFYVVNRLHQELKIPVGVPEWLATGSQGPCSLDLMDASLFNPESMVSAVLDLLGSEITDPADWAGLALESMARTIAAQIGPLEGLIGQEIGTIRLSGGGSRSRALCQRLASVAGRTVLAGPAEATVVGNLACSLKALGEEFEIAGKVEAFS